MDGWAKVLSALRDLPLWLLAGIAISLSLALFLPTLKSAMPAAPWIAFFALLFAVLTVSRFMSIFMGQWMARRDAIRRREQRALTRIYQPIYVLFLTRHVTGVSSVGARRLSDRLANAREALGSFRSRKAGVKAAFKAIFDKKEHTSAEIEFGGDFPLARIIEIVRANSSVADLRLMKLVRWADRSIYEDEHGGGLMTDAELELLNYVNSRMANLSKRNR